MGVGSPAEQPRWLLVFVSMLNVPGLAGATLNFSHCNDGTFCAPESQVAFGTPWIVRPLSAALSNSGSRRKNVPAPMQSCFEEAVSLRVAASPAATVFFAVALDVPDLLSSPSAAT